MTKQVHLAAHFPGVNNTTVWSDPKSGSHIEFSSFEHLAQVTGILVPELQRRGAFRAAYPAEGWPSTLRGLLGLSRPANRYNLDVA